MGKFSHKKKSNNTPNANLKDTPIAQMGQDYCVCTKSLGDRRFELQFTSGFVKIGTLRGKIKKNKKNWVSRGSILLASFRSYQDNKVDILYVYNDDELKYLYKIQEISKNWKNSIIDNIKDDNIGDIDIVEEEDEECAFNIDEI